MVFLTVIHNPKARGDPSIKVPKRIINPTYDKFMEVIGQGE